MKSTDIRKGNWIASGTEFKNTSTIGKVLSIGNDDCEFEQLEVECDESFEWFWKDNYCGIPITEERLLKLGFEFNQYNQKVYNLIFEDATGNYALFNFKFFKNGRVDYNLNGITESVKNIKDMKFQFIHQLQNLYNATTFKEMIINDLYESHDA